MKQFLKTFYFRVCFYVSRVAGLFGGVNGPIVLMYHSVGDNSEKLTVSASAFRAQMEYLSLHRKVGSMDDLLLYLRGEKKIPANSILVTIDDGYLDTYREAFPILKEFRIPFTLFLTTNLEPLKPLGNLPRPSWDQLREMAAVGLMIVGLHGHNHLHVNEIAGDRVSLDKELKDSAALIEKEIGTAPTVYAYAFGARDPRIPSYVKGIGIEAAFGITDGTVTAGRDSYALPRVQIDSTMSESLFRLRTTAAVEIAFLWKRNLRRWTSRLWKKSQ